MKDVDASLVRNPLGASRACVWLGCLCCLDRNMPVRGVSDGNEMVVPWCLCCVVALRTVFVFQPVLDDFHQAFEVVFVDPSGLVNLCADMTASKYHQVPSRL